MFIIQKRRKTANGNRRWTQVVAEGASGTDRYVLEQTAIKWTAEDLVFEYGVSSEPE